MIRELRFCYYDKDGGLGMLDGEFPQPWVKMTEEECDKWGIPYVEKQNDIDELNLRTIL